jgi:rhodanese-related sulfurtransferase
MVRRKVAWARPFNASPGCASLISSNSINNQESPVPTKDPREPFGRVNVAEAKQLLDEGKAVMVDVREPNEYVEVHAKGVRLVPVNTVITEVKQIRDLAGGKEVLFICRSGQRSALAAEYAVAAGLNDLTLYNVEGGTLAWVEAGFPTGD